MFKKLLFFILFACAFIQTKVQAQPPANPAPTLCGTDTTLLRRMGILTNVHNIPLTYPSAAMIACGKFMVYYDDIALSSGAGFAEPAAGLGAIRRNTVCSVLSYLQSLFDFSKVPSGQYIRLHVAKSLYGAAPFDNRLGYGAPFYDTPIVFGSVVNGFVQRYLTTAGGSDPAPGNYHGEIQINFDSTYLWNIDAVNHYSSIGPVSYQNSTDSVQNCQFDLYTVILHMMSHVMGWHSMTDVFHGGTFAGGCYTNMDTSIMMSPYPYSSTVAFTTAEVPAYLGTAPVGWFLGWMDRSQYPNRTATYYNTIHSIENAQWDHVGSGASQNHVMRDNMQQGLMTRYFAKEELKIYHDVLKYTFNSSTFSGSGPTAQYYSNHRPYCSKNYLLAYCGGWFNEESYFDTLKADFTLTNNTGSSLVINLAADTSLHDQDGDTIRIIPESVVNFRGCGSGGNNHKLLSLSNGNRTITYTPRHNFYGRAQLGFNVTDSKEKGTFVVYTVDVAKGSNVSVAYGDNLVLNGDFEEGTETKIADTAELVNNTNLLMDYGGANYVAWLKNGTYFSDAQPYSNPPVIRNSYQQCQDSKQVPYGFGSIYFSFPWPGDTLGFGPYSFKNPEAAGAKGNRYSGIIQTAAFNLGDSLRKCHDYLLEFDALRTMKVNYPGTYPYVYPLTDTFSIAFTDGSQLIKTSPLDAVKYQTLRPYPAPDLKAQVWTHFSIPFSYCSTTPATVLCLHAAITGGLSAIGKYPWTAWASEAPYLLDNVSIKEQPFTVTIKDSVFDPCVYRLTAIPKTNDCSDLNYTWTNLAGTVIGTTAVIDVSPTKLTSYIVTVTNGCKTAKDTVTLQALSCPCGPASVFGDTSGFYTLKGTVPAVSGYRFYYVPSDALLSGTTTIGNANVLIAPNARISVADSVLLTIDSSHLFTCASNTMWKGITLLSSSTRSARILVQHNSMIEDADTAISSRNPKTPSSGRVISTTDAIYNRNGIDIYIAGYSNASAGFYYPFYFSGNVFTARQFSSVYPKYPLSWPLAVAVRKRITPTDAKAAYVISKSYSAVNTKKGSMSQKGILLDGVGYSNLLTDFFTDITVGDSVLDSSCNVFDTHMYGIYALNSNLRGYNNHFINISMTLSPKSYGTIPAPTDGGVGIYSATSSLFNKNEIVLEDMQANTNRFHDCLKGIFLDHTYKAVINGSFMTSSHTDGTMTPGAYSLTDLYNGYGIYANVDASQGNYSFLNNKISNIHNGIFLYYNLARSGSSVSLNSNKLYGSNPELSSFTGGQYMAMGISAYMAMDWGYPSSISMTNNNMTQLRCGAQFSVYGKCQLTAEYNNIDIKDDGVYWIDHTGIALTSTSNATLKYNDVSTSSLGGTYTKGYYTAFTKTTTLCSNKEKLMGKGFEFAAVTPQTGTQWSGNTMDGGRLGFVLGSDIGNQVTTGTTFVASWAGGNTWNGFGAGTFQTFTDGAPIRSTNSKLCVRNIPGVELPSSNNGTDPRYVYTLGSSLLINSNLYGCGQLVSIPRPFPFSFVSSGLLESILADTMGYTPDWRATQWMAQFGLWQEGLADSSFKDSSAVFLQFMNAAAGSRFNWLTDIEQAIQAGSLNTAHNLLANPVPAMGRLVVNPAVVVTDITDADYVVQHYVDYYKLYIKAAQGTIDSTDLVDLHAIAALCPAIDGAVVYRARSLYRQYADNWENFRDDSCIYASGRTLKMAQGTDDIRQSYSLYPNPNNGRFYLQQQLSDKGPVQLKIYDLQGRLVYRSALNFGNSREATVQPGPLAAGIYLLQLQDLQGQHYTLKCNVQ